MRKPLLARLDRYVGAAALILVSAVWAVGSWAQFTLPYFPGTLTTNPCYFTDHLIVVVSCPSNTALSLIVGTSWHFTWGAGWVLPLTLMDPVSLFTLVWLAWAAAMAFAVRFVLTSLIRLRPSPSPTPP